MTEYKAQDITKAADFISSINNLINGKFILADVKIAQVLKKIEDSPALFEYIQQSLIGFSFERDFRKSEITNRFNGGVFKLPAEEKTAIALIFCLLVEFDSKSIDFYEFIKDNFPTLDNKGDYHAFSETVLVPFRDVVAFRFGLSKEDNVDVIKELRGEVSKEILEEEKQREIKIQEKTKEDLLFEDMHRIEKHLLEIIKSDPKIKPDKKENLVFILKAMIYSNKYKDLKIINALLVSFEFLGKKINSIRFVYDELKGLIIDYYNGK
jgi:type III secretion system FlhB-like substrate exporter